MRLNQSWQKTGNIYLKSVIFGTIVNPYLSNICTDVFCPQLDATNIEKHFTNLRYSKILPHIPVLKVFCNIVLYGNCV